MTAKRFELPPPVRVVPARFSLPAPGMMLPPGLSEHRWRAPRATRVLLVYRTKSGQGKQIRGLRIGKYEELAVDKVPCELLTRALSEDVRYLQLLSERYDTFKLTLSTLSEAQSLVLTMWNSSKTEEHFCLGFYGVQPEDA